MEDFGQSELVKMLVRQGLSHNRAGTRVLAGIKEPGATMEAHTGSLPDAEEGAAPGIRLVSVTLRQTTHCPTRVAPRGVVSLKVINGGKR